MEWLASKIGVLIAIGVITSFALGLFAWQHSALVDREGQGVADSISYTLDSVAGLEAATKLNISYGNSPGQLPLTIGRDCYTVNITADTVIVSCGGRTWISKPVARVITGNIAERQMNLTEFGKLFSGSISLEHSSGECFTVERVALEISGSAEYATMVYWN